MMRAHALTSPSASRPKVHRLPARSYTSPRQRRLSAALSYGTTAQFVFMLSSFVLAIVFSALIISQFLPADILHQDVIPPATAAAVSEGASQARQGKTIILKEKNGTIIGQMTKIPTTGAPATEVDNRKRQELLSIVNRH